MITAKSAATIWRGVEAAFTQLRPRGYDADLLTALAAEEVPDLVTDAFRSGDYWKAQAAFLSFHGGRWFRDLDGGVAVALLTHLKASTAEGGEELLRRFANAARGQFIRVAHPLMSGSRTLRMFPPASKDLDSAMAASGYEWQDDRDEYVKESTTTVPEVPTVPAVVALVQQADFGDDAEKLITRMLELAEEGLSAKDMNGWTTATTKARDVVREVIENVSAKLGLQTTNQTDARKRLTKAGVTTAEQEERVYLIYKAVCEAAHGISSGENAVLDVAVCLVLAEFVLRKYLGRP